MEFVFIYLGGVGILQSRVSGRTLSLRYHLWSRAGRIIRNTVLCSQSADSSFYRTIRGKVQKKEKKITQNNVFTLQHRISFPKRRGDKQMINVHL